MKQERDDSFHGGICFCLGFHLVVVRKVKSYSGQLGVGSGDSSFSGLLGARDSPTQLIPKFIAFV